MDLLSDAHGSQHCEHHDGEGEETAEGVYNGVHNWKLTWTVRHVLCSVFVFWHKLVKEHQAGLEQR